MFALVAGLLTAGLGAIAAPAPAQAAAEGCGYADSSADNGAHASTICWFDFSAFDETQARSDEGQPMEIVLEGGYIARFDVKVTDVPGAVEMHMETRSTPLEQRFAFGSDAYRGVPGENTLYSLPSPAGVKGATLTFDDIEVVDSEGNAVIGYSFVAADTEDNVQGESFVWTSDKALTEIERLRPEGSWGCKDPVGVGTTQISCAGTGSGGSSTAGGKSTALLVAADSPTVFSTQWQTHARSGIAIGIQTAKVSLTKTIADRWDADDSFDISVTSPEDAVLGTASTGTASNATTGAVTVLPRSTGAVYTLAETATPTSSTDLSDYTTAWNCVNVTAGSTTVLPDGSGTTKTLAPAIGDDIRCEITNTAIPYRDFGDAPDSHNTTLAANGAQHRILEYDAETNTAPLMLGETVDAEEDGQPTDAADGDDRTDASDEDAVDTIEIVPGAGSTVAVSATNDTDAVATLAGWIDLDGSGAFDADELATVSVPAASGTASYDLTFPGGTTVADTFARFRLFPGAVAAPSATGSAAAGEVEDHAVTIAALPLPAVCTAEQTRATERFWFFGQNGAVDFGTSGSAAEPFTGSQITREGSTVVTDTSGALQFWSNGQEVFDRNSEPMPNGTGLLGNRSATQTVAAFPALGQPGKYFVVATSTDVGTAPNGSLTYSMIDMSLNGGLGDVTDVKNVPLGAAATASEAVTAVPNADGTGFWVLTHTNNSPNILAYEFDADGPVTGTAVVNVMPSNNFHGYGSLAFSADYTSAVALTARWNASGGSVGNLPTTVRILKFNAETGQLFQEYQWSLPTTVGSGGMGYNAEFSPDGRYVYATKIFGGAQLYRYEVAGASTGPEVKATEQNLGLIGTYGGQIRRAPDGRMYVANLNATSLGVVEEPDAADPGFVASGFPLAAGAVSQYGLPQTVTGCPPPTGVLEIDKASTMTADSRPGDTVEYTLTVENTGAGDFTAEHPAVVFDDLTAVVDDAVYNDDAAAAASDGGDAPAPAFLAPAHLSWAGPIAAGESVEITYSVTLGSAGDGIVRNVAWQPQTPPPTGELPTTPACDPAGEEGVDPVTGEACASVENAMPRVSVSKTSDVTDLPADGGEVTYSVTVRNEGPGVYTDDAPARVTDDLSAVLDDAEFGEILTPSTGAAFDAEKQELTWSGPLEAGENVTISYTVTYDATTGDNILFNEACVPANQVAPGSENCASVRIPAAELQVMKSVDPADGTPVEAGQPLTYTIEFRSLGQTAAVVDKIDDLAGVLDDASLVGDSIAVDGNGLSAVLEGTDLIITGAVPAGEVTTVSYSVTVNAHADQGDHVLGNVVQNADGSCDVEGCPETTNPIRHFAVTKSATPVEGVQPGDVVEYTITVTNDGEADYTAVAPAGVRDDMSDVLDDASYNRDAEAISSTGAVIPGPAFAAEVLTWAGPLPVGEVVTITYSVTVTNQGDADLVNSASPVCGAGVICDPSTPPVEVLLPRITPDKTSDPASGSDVAAGAVITYTLTFTNDGQATGEVGATDDLSDVIDDAALTGDPQVDLEGVSAVYDADAQTIRVEGALAPGQVVTVTYAVTVGADGERGDNIVGNVLTADTPPYACAEDDEDCAPFAPPITEHRVGELDDWKTADPASGGAVQPGQVVTYTLHFENTGEAPVAVDREDVLTQVLDDATMTSAPESSDAALTVSAIADSRFGIAGSLEPGELVTVTYQVTVNADGERGDDRLGNVLVNAGEEPPTECAPADQERPDCTVNHVSFVVASKSADPADGTAVEQGRQVTYTLSFRNVSTNADAPAAPVDFTDHMANVLDDATVTGAPRSSDESVAASMSEDTIRVTGEVASGATVTVTYTVTVKSWEQQGDHLLGNVIAVTGEEPVCAPGSDLCTSHELTPPQPLAITGGGIAWGAAITALALLILGGGAVLFSRRRRSEIATSES